ncbi:polymer-forming cytoskeletal protein [Desulfobacterota bacterium AH_259_B03_O07]|nr:polymer-forming cytoskeletal protein [Desulfobacterota bacterium AH_259_B03_O07]
MFRRKKSREYSNTNPSEIRTLISEECEFEGEIKTTSSTRIDGKFKGRVNLEGSLIVGEQGEVTGELKADEIIVYGKVAGMIECKKLEIKKSGSLEGDIQVERLVVEGGGRYNGRCIMDHTYNTIMVESYSEQSKKVEGSNKKDQAPKALGK